MKKILLLTCFITFTCLLKSQDKIIKRNGEEFTVTIVKSTEDAVHFKYPNEEIINEISKKRISKILYSSGRIEECNKDFEIPVVNGKKDWRKVVVTYLESDVKGLTRVKEIKTTSGWGGALMSSVGYNDAINKLKKQAAKLNAPVILINESPNKHAAALGGGVKIVGVCYK